MAYACGGRERSPVEVRALALALDTAKGCGEGLEQEEGLHPSAKNKQQQVTRYQIPSYFHGSHGQSGSPGTSSGSLLPFLCVRAGCQAGFKIMCLYLFMEYCLCLAEMESLSQFSLQVLMVVK